ncbi:hypothetical protein KBC77_04045 [Candidatus Saccharibacteria bacterium]|nr:hypothetical protein [Candidatus Saccharibacteria bacterium]
MDVKNAVGRLRPIGRFLFLHGQALCFLGILIFSATAVLTLRANNQGMIVLRQAVYDADEKNGDVEGALRELREYVYAHMNTGLSSGSNPVRPPIQLKYTYERLQKERQQQTSNINSTLYNEAVKSCASQNVLDSELITCINRFLAERGVNVDDIPDALYKFDFVSAKWSPDAAGFSLLALVLSIFGFVFFAAANLIRAMRAKRATRKAAQAQAVGYQGYR